MKVEGGSLDCGISLSKWKGNTGRSETLHRTQPWYGWPMHSGRERHVTEDQELKILEEMPEREANISAPAQEDQWFTLWPESTSRQSSHRKIMSPSNEFMQMAVHLSKIKKSHFHFKMRTVEVLSRQEQTKSQYQYVTSFCSCLLSDFSGSLHHQTYTALLVQKGTWLYPIKSHIKSRFLKRYKWKTCGLCRQMFLQCNFWIKNKHSKIDNC